MEKLLTTAACTTEKGKASENLYFLAFLLYCDK